MMPAVSLTGILRVPYPHLTVSEPPAGRIKHPRRKTPKACWRHPSDGCGEAIRSLCIHIFIYINIFLFFSVERAQGRVLDNVYTAACLMRGTLRPLRRGRLLRRAATKLLRGYTAFRISFTSRCLFAFAFVAPSSRC